MKMVSASYIKRKKVIIQNAFQKAEFHEVHGFVRVYR